MTRRRQPHELRFGAGTTWLNLLATLRRPLGDAAVERIPDPARLSEWLAVSGLAPRRRPGATDVEHAHELREALRALAVATVNGTAPDKAAVARVNRWLAASPGRSHARAGEASITLDPPADTGQALARIARSAVEDLAGPTAADLHSCQADDCGAVFLDPSGRRRWCSSATCGNRARVRAHRARQAEAPRPKTPVR
jgi:predicted RNA-binding Zn ribbon-like protein